MKTFKEFLELEESEYGHPYLDFLVSPIYPEELYETTIPIKSAEQAGSNAGRRVKAAFDAIGEGKNPHTGEPLPKFGSKEHKEIMKGVHERLKKNHGVNGKSLLAGNLKMGETKEGSGHTIKDKEGKEIFMQGMSGAPAHSCGGINTCPKASTECKASCLGKTSGAMARVPATMEAKKRKTEALIKSPEDTALALHHHIQHEQHIADKGHKGGKPYSYVVRMNTTTDHPQKWYEGLRKANPKTQFHDYTKEPKQVLHNLDHKGEEGQRNLHLTFSSTGVHHPESNWEDARKILRKGGNVAMVSRAKNAIKGKEEKEHNKLPKVVHDTETGEKWPTLDGDGRSKDMPGHGDARHLDKPGHIAMLHLKGVTAEKAGNFAVPHDHDRVAHVSTSKHKLHDENK